MSAGGRYIPVNSAYASPVIEKAGLGERRGVRGALLRKDTAEAGESTFCLEFIMGSVSLYHASAHDILVDKDVSTPTRNLNSTSSAWRPSVRNTPSSATAGFEGVLGSFGSPVSTPSRQKSMGEGGILDQSTGQTAWKERERTTSATDAAAGILPGSGGGPGWGKTGRWRSAAQQQEDEDALKVSTGLVSRSYVLRVDKRSANFSVQTSLLWPINWTTRSQPHPRLSSHRLLPWPRGTINLRSLRPLTPSRTWRPSRTIRRRVRLVNQSLVRMNRKLRPSNGSTEIRLVTNKVSIMTPRQPGLT
jgi:hypothetical protein